MADGDGTAEPTTASTNEVDKLMSKVESILSGHRTATDSELSKLRQEIQDMASSNKREFEERLTEISESYKHVDEWIQSEISARAEKDRIKDSESTIVMPPQDVLPPPVQEPPPDQTAAGDGPGKRSVFRRVW